ncbi:MAG TPA: serine/threonine-protein kinase, partial [Thermoanaerobaculia bacterium]|nr:serine/threonine-protein kinase [Thermoanaerobaculia bacterium]
MSDRETATIACLRDRPVERAAKTEGLAPGTRVGRFVVLYRLGAGGMGSVHAAYDPRLDRKVAIKLLHRQSAAEAEVGAAAAPDLEREARALARLSHPNVVTVHELGTADGRPFVAMELVEGRTLGDWLNGGERSWREVLWLFRAAGEGLAAAHDLGVVHQDFKPSNVMVTGDGGVRVLDFGLAAMETQRTAGAEGVWGTPPYVAPERLEGAPADARGDQFGFCVALHEALWGRPPEWDTEGEPRRPPGRSRVPLVLWDALARGLARRPGDRHPSMVSLLAALDFERRSRRRRRALAVAAAVLAVTAVGYAALSSAPAELCGGGPERVGAVWNDGRRAEVLRAFRATGLPVADAAAALVGDRIDRFLASWQGSYAEACRATHVLGEQSDQLLDRRMLCLDARLAEVDALAGIFAAANPEIVLGAAESTHRLGDLERCADSEGLSRLPELPADPAARRRVETATARLAEQRARQAAGQPPETTVVEAVAETAREAGYLPLETEALVLLTR